MATTRDFVLIQQLSRTSLMTTTVDIKLNIYSIQITKEMPGDEFHELKWITANHITLK